LELGQRESVEKSFTVEKLVELYLTQYIEDRKFPSGRKIAGARKPKGQSETRRTLYGDAIPKLGEMPANAVTRKAVVDMIMAIVQRGANVQAGNVLRELSAAYENGCLAPITLQHRRMFFGLPSGQGVVPERSAMRPGRTST
jgi:hypothetical protein